MSTPQSSDSTGDTSETTQELASRINGAAFGEWNSEREIRENVRNGTPFFNGPSDERPPERHSPSALLQCHRKLFYRQLNAPEESADPKGIFWFGTHFEEDLIVPFLDDAIARDAEYVQNSIWIDYTAETDAGQIQIKGATDPVLVTRTGAPLLPTEIKTKSSVGNLDAPNEHHRAQIHAYLAGLNEKFDLDGSLDSAVILYGSRETLDVQCFHIEFDRDFWEETVLDWASDHTTYRLQGEIPPAEPRYDWECQFCSYRTRCGQADDDYSDLAPEGLLPEQGLYPREKVQEYLETHPNEKLPPNVATDFPSVAEEHGAYDWVCPVCSTTYSWTDIEQSNDPNGRPNCRACGQAGRGAIDLKPLHPGEGNRRP